MLAQVSSQGPGALEIIVIAVTSIAFWAAAIWGIIRLFKYIRKREKRLGGGIQMSLGVTGLILVTMRILMFLLLGGTELGSPRWFIANIGNIASHVGLVVSIVGIFKNSGRWAGIAGVIQWVAWGLFNALVMRQAM